MAKTWLAPVIVLAALLCGCKAGISAAGTGSERPTVLRYAHSAGSEEPEAQTLRLERLQVYLAKQLGMTVELYKTSSYGAVIEAMRARKVDVATMGPFAYLIASEKAGAEVLAVRGTLDGGPGDYGGTIAVARNSPIKTIEELVARSKELTFSFVDPASGSGFLIQQAYLQSQGIDPRRDFKKTMFSTSHLISAMTLIAGKVDAAAIMETKPGNTIYKALYTRGRVRHGDIRVLWTSPRMPSSPIAVRRDLPAGFKRELQQAFVDMPQLDPELWKLWPKSGGPDLTTVLLPGNDAMFDGLRAMARGIPNLSLLER